MYQTLLRLWKENRLTEAQLDNAISKGWIDSEQKEIIINTPKNPANEEVLTNQTV